MTHSETVCPVCATLKQKAHLYECYKNIEKKVQLWCFYELSKYV